MALGRLLQLRCGTDLGEGFYAVGTANTGTAESAPSPRQSAMEGKITPPAYLFRGMIPRTITNCLRFD